LNAETLRLWKVLEVSQLNGNGVDFSILGVLDPSETESPTCLGSVPFLHSDTHRRTISGNRPQTAMPINFFKNGSPDFRLPLILRRKFASYCVVGSQLPTVACLIHAEARCVQMFCCSFATFLVLCWTTETATGDWPNHRVSGSGI